MTGYIYRIHCLANHKDYIAQALESILMQEVTFPYEIIIHDDASTDGTTDIIREYEKKYPHIIKPIYQTENQFSQGKDILIVGHGAMNSSIVCQIKNIPIEKFWSMGLEQCKIINILC